MQLVNQIKKLAAYPIGHSTMVTLLRDYNNRNDKLHQLIKGGMLQPIRKGLYIAGPQIEGPKPEPFLLANHITGPSYVTAETVLSYYGLIPERVYSIVSATTKSSKTFQTSIGRFVYRHLPLPYYSFGVKSVPVTKDQYVMMGAPIKALFDKIVFTPGLVLRSRVRARQFLVEDLRIDESALRQLDRNGVEDWIPQAPKSQSLQFVLEVIQQL